MTTTQFDITALLEQAGARPRGNRFDCSKCGGVRSITHTDECFFCHKCHWTGNTVTLARELGIQTRVSFTEYREIQHRREQAHQLAERVKARMRELQDDLRSLARIESGAHEAGPDRPLVWDALALVYRQRPIILAELAYLEFAHAARAMRFLESAPDQQRAVCVVILERGGLLDSAGKIVEVSPC